MVRCARLSCHNVTGFNAGHSSFTYLTARPDVIVHSFDIRRLPMVLFLQRKFPGRLKFILGDSRKKVPRYFATSRQSNQPITCDLMVVDSSHDGDVPLNDLRNFARAASQPHNVIFADDMHLYAVRSAWIKLVRAGIIQELFTCNFFALGMAVRRYK